MDENLLMYVNDRSELATPIREIMRKITKYIYNKDKTTPKYEKKMNELKLYIETTSKLRYRNYINDSQYNEENIFNIPITNGCNMLMMCCIYKIDEDFCMYIIKKYGELFELGEINEQDETALIISIKNDMFDVAAALLDYRLNELYEEPHNNLSQSYINLFCENREFWGPLLEEDFENDKRIDFKPTNNEHTNKVCDNILKAIPDNMEVEVISTKPIEERKRTYEEIDMPSATEVQEFQPTRIEEDGRVIKTVPLRIEYGGKSKRNKSKRNKSKKNTRKNSRSTKKKPVPTKEKKQKKTSSTKTKKHPKKV